MTEGGIKERMTAARLGYRTDMRQQLAAAQQEIAVLKAEVARLQAMLDERDTRNTR